MNWTAIWVFLLLVTMAAGGAAFGQTPGPILLSEASGVGRGSGSAVYESEHIPVAVRKYRVISGYPFGQLEAVVRHPDGSVAEADVDRGEKGITVSFETPFGDGPMHGIHTLYLTDRQVADGRLVVRTAKWYTIHHNCGWGHEYKYDEARTRAWTQATNPLEITCQGLWDGNFHNAVQSGDTLLFEISSFGRPASGARVRLTSGQGWEKNASSGSDGSVSLQLIRDYYADKWNEFDKRHKERFVALAEYETDEQGTFAGEAYDRVYYLSSIPWTYVPDRDEYTSVTLGLLIGFLTMAVVGVGIFVYRERRRRPYREMTFNE